MTPDELKSLNDNRVWGDHIASGVEQNVTYHHVIVVGSGDRDRPTDEGAKAAFCVTLIACLLAYALIKF